MAPSEPLYHLRIATDDSRTVVALAPLRAFRSPLWHEWGSGRRIGRHRPDSSTSRAGQSLIEQRERLKASWNQIEAEALRIRTALELAAVAAENAAHDPGVSGAVREAHQELADVYGGGAN